ncbi:hypothetical protein I7I48_06023 [Histoplasma ohiense]|nr:hypothetical protein I7I48_06023 [Histoplasma ohiense (nom. inval.)]
MQTDGKCLTSFVWHIYVVSSPEPDSPVVLPQIALSRQGGEQSSGKYGHAHRPIGLNDLQTQARPGLLVGILPVTEEGN